MNIKEFIPFFVLGIASAASAQGLVVEEVVNNEPQATQVQPAQQTPEQQPTQAPVQTNVPAQAQAPAAAPAEQAPEQAVPVEQAAAPQPAPVAQAPVQQAPAKQEPVASNQLDNWDTWDEPQNINPTQPAQPEPQPAQTQTPAQAEQDLIKTAEQMKPAQAPAPVEAAMQPAPQPVPVKPQAPANTHVLNVIHSSAYNMAGNEAAAPTVAGNLAVPHKMYGSRYAYLEPVNEMGAVSFGQSTTYFVAFNNEAELGLLTAGFAFESFGFSVNTAMGKDWNYIDAPEGEYTELSTTGGTLWGGTISFNIAGIDIALGADYVYPETQTYTSEGNLKVDPNIWELNSNLMISYAPDMDFAWTFNVGVSRHDATLKTTEKSTQVIDGKTYIATTRTTVSDTTSHIAVIPQFNIGGTVLKSENSRVLLGLNTIVPLFAFDQIDNVCSRHNEYGVFFVPNIVAEASLSKYLMVFGGANYVWNAFSMRDSFINEVSIKQAQMKTDVVTVDIGTRIQYENFAVEMAFQKDFLKNPFGAFSDKDEISMSLSAFVNF